MTCTRQVRKVLVAIGCGLAYFHHSNGGQVLSVIIDADGCTARSPNWKCASNVGSENRTAEQDIVGHEAFGFQPRE